MRDERRASDLKELQVHFKVNLSTRVGPKRNFFAVISRISAIETVEHSLVVLLSIFHFEKVCFPSENGG